MTLKELIMKYDFDSIMPGLEMRDDQINPHPHFRHPTVLPNLLAKI